MLLGCLLRVLRTLKSSVGNLANDLGGTPPVRAGFLERSEGRIIAATVFGVCLSVVGGLLIVEYLNATTGVGGRFFDVFWSFTYFFAAFPPFVPILLPSALFTRGIKEGATAGFITVFLVVVLPLIIESNGQITFQCETGLCGLAITVTLLSPLVGDIG